MRELLRKARLTPSMMVALLALFISLSGVADAVATITSADIRDGTIQARDLAPNAVTSPKIATGAVGTSDIAANAVNSGRILDGAVRSEEIQDGSIDDPDIKDGGIPQRGIQPSPHVAVSGQPPGGISSGTIGPCTVSTPSWVTEDTDTFNMHSDVFNDNQHALVAPRAGLYRVTATMAWDAVGGGSRYMDFQVNNLVTNKAMGSTSAALTGTGLSQTSTIEVRLPVGGSVSLLVAACNYTGDPSYSTAVASRFSMSYVSA